MNGSLRAQSNPPTTRGTSIRKRRCAISLAVALWIGAPVGMQVLAQPFTATQAAGPITEASATLNGMATPNGLPTVAWFVEAQFRDVLAYRLEVRLAAGNEQRLDYLAHVAVKRGVCQGIDPLLRTPEQSRSDVVAVLRDYMDLPADPAEAW